jgi:hypothetical protein
VQEQQPPTGGRSSESSSQFAKDAITKKYIDPTIWHWWFFLRGRDFQNVTRQDGNFSRRDRHWEVFKNALQGAVSHTGKGNKALSFSLAEDPTKRNRYPSSFAKVQRDSTQTIQMSMHALSRLDSTYIRFSWTQKGRTGSEAFSTLSRKDWKYSTDDPVFLGDATCLMAELTKPEDETEKFSLAKDWCRQILCEWQGRRLAPDDTFQIDLVEVACGFFATSAELEKVVWVLLVWNDDDARTQAARLINAITPPFMLAWLKARHIKQEYEDDIAPKSYQAETDVETALSQKTKQTNKLKALEEFSLQTSLASSELTRQIDHSEERLVTLDINKENLENLLKDQVFRPGEALMDSLLVAPIRLTIDQIKTDLRYVTLQQKRAKDARENSNAIVGILTNRWTRRITIVLGVFAIFGVVQAFNTELEALGKLYPLTAFGNELPSWNQGWPKVATVLLGLVILPIFIKLISRNE